MEGPPSYGECKASSSDDAEERRRRRPRDDSLRPSLAAGETTTGISDRDGESK